MAAFQKSQSSALAASHDETLCRPRCPQELDRYHHCARWEANLTTMGNEEASFSLLGFPFTFDRTSRRTRKGPERHRQAPQERCQLAPGLFFLAEGRRGRLKREKSRPLLPLPLQTIPIGWSGPAERDAKEQSHPIDFLLRRAKSFLFGRRQ